MHCTLIFAKKMGVSRSVIHRDFDRAVRGYISLTLFLVDCGAERMFSIVVISVNP